MKEIPMKSRGHFSRHPSFYGYVLAAVCCASSACSATHDHDAADDQQTRDDRFRSDDRFASDDQFSGDDWDGMTDFIIRVPQEHTLTCTGTGGGQIAQFMDIDQVCRIANAALNVDLYIQTTPTACTTAGWVVPTTYGASAFIKRNHTIEPVAVASYDYGGNHHNDTITFTLDNETHVLWHSSIGYGGRRCAPIDCQIRCGTNPTCDEYSGFTVNGCERAAGSGPPPLPVICVVVNADGSLPPLLDPWTAHTGYPDYPLLPCPGEQ
jgi:hypothetical protein